MTLRATHRGFTLIELMVSMLIGLLLIAGILSVFVNSKRTYTARDSLSIMEENGRVAIRRLQRGIAPAGFPFHEDVVPVLFADAGVANVDFSVDGTDSLGDRITIAYRPIGLNTEDCLGSAVVQEGRIINSYFVAADNTLQCDGGASGGSQPLAEGVESLQVLYGLDEDEDGFADHYLNASQMATSIAATPDQQLAIVSIQVSLLVNSQNLAKDQTPNEAGFAPRTYTLLDQQITEPNDDRLARRVFTTTIPLRNRMPL